ncbi:hypothetical protein SETIT_7G042200v2 [Setaria italica]|uniref:Uncharacterized protein n=1 Tax=Setaria italica TaxID=4555 RepID=A0A368RRQ5_SETIT|nr:hypothetical protein SETIT_7G042200v2 [Setaria italica]
MPPLAAAHHGCRQHQLPRQARRRLDPLWARLAEAHRCPAITTRLAYAGPWSSLCLPCHTLALRTPPSIHARLAGGGEGRCPWRGGRRRIRGGTTKRRRRRGGVGERRQRRGGSGAVRGKEGREPGRGREGRSTRGRWGPAVSRKKGWGREECVGALGIFALHVTQSVNEVLSTEHIREICRYIYNIQL